MVSKFLLCLTIFNVLISTIIVYRVAVDLVDSKVPLDRREPLGLTDIPVILDPVDPQERMGVKDPLVMWVTMAHQVHLVIKVILDLTDSMDIP